MRCVLGVDGGNTKTIALVATLDGAIIGAGRSGSGDIYNAISAEGHADTEATALKNIETAIQMALHQAQVSLRDIQVAVFNMAGADWPEDIAFLQQAMADRFSEQGGDGRIIVQNDALGVLNAASGADVGVSVICGTGVAIGARAANGQTWHTSFWQDETQGSSHLAQKMLFAVYRAELGMGPPTSLTNRVLEYFQAGTVEEVLHRYTGRLHSQTLNVTGLTPILLDEAALGDPIARVVVIEHGQSLGQFAQAAARRVGIEGTPFTIVFGGGVFRHSSPLLMETITQQVRTTSPDVRPNRSRFEPAVSVILGTLEIAGTPLNDALVERIIASTPPAIFFATIPTLEKSDSEPFL